MKLIAKALIAKNKNSEVQSSDILKRLNQIIVIKTVCKNIKNQVHLLIIKTKT